MQECRVLQLMCWNVVSRAGYDMGPCDEVVMGTILARSVAGPNRQDIEGTSYPRAGAAYRPEGRHKGHGSDPENAGKAPAWLCRSNSTWPVDGNECTRSVVQARSVACDA
jgi:hypothetical protein